MNPQVVGLDLRRWDLVGPIRDIRVSEEVKDEVERHMRVAVAPVLDAGRAKGNKVTVKKSTSKKSTSKKSDKVKQ